MLFSKNATTSQLRRRRPPEGPSLQRLAQRSKLMLFQHGEGTAYLTRTSFIMRPDTFQSCT